MRSRGPTGRASIRAADDVLEADLQSDEILACFEEALGERQPEMGTDAAAGREANAESAEAAPRLEAAAEQQREHSLLAPTAGRGVEPVLPDPVPMLHTNSGGGRRSCEPDAGARQQIGSAAASILERRGEAARAKVLDKVRDAGRADGDPAAPQRRRMASTTPRNACLIRMRRQRSTGCSGWCAAACGFMANSLRPRASMLMSSGRPLWRRGGLYGRW